MNNVGTKFDKLAEETIENFIAKIGLDADTAGPCACVCFQQYKEGVRFWEDSEYFYVSWENLGKIFATKNAEDFWELSSTVAEDWEVAEKWTEIPNC